MPKSPQNWPFSDKVHACVTRLCAISPSRCQGC
ncbi:hypothetical protein F383_36465 [Gossypium arboreum]|uniref:Uncharacterized protein n=1 Tax=Gossypium arboreum TaxID=29729 RepID=A0A0B0Q093_GOSAR|nr:hypothetical protein F383_36465 [Gossypium arboreum]